MNTNTNSARAIDYGFDLGVVSRDLRDAIDNLVGNVTLLAPNQSRSNILEAARQIEGIASTIELSAYFQRMTTLDRAINDGLPKAQPVAPEPSKEAKPKAKGIPESYSKYDLAAMMDVACPYCEAEPAKPCRQVERGATGRILDTPTKKTHLARRQTFRGEEVTQFRAVAS